MDFTVSTALIAIGGIGVIIFLLGAIGYVIMASRGGRMSKTPFVKTGDLAAQGDAVCGEKNAISTEGKLVKPAQMLISPVEGKECLMYRVEVSASWKVGEDKKSVKIREEKNAVDFHLDDGSGPVKVSPTTTGDFEPLNRFSKTAGKGLKAAFTGGGIKFGAKEYEVHPGGKHNGKVVPDSAKITVKETCLLPSEMFYANGKWEDGAIRKHSWSSLMLTPQSRDVALAATQKTQQNAKRAAIGGGIIAPIFLGLGMLLAPSADDGKSDTSSTKTEQVEQKSETPKTAEKKTEKKAEKKTEKKTGGDADGAEPSSTKSTEKAGGKRAGRRAGKGGKGGKRKR
jgi:hypothetical protein